MKKISIVCLTALMSCAAALVNCEAALAQEKEMRYENALNFRMINKGVPDGVTSNPYQRYPDALKDSVVAQLWNTATNSAGLGIRFRSDSKTIAVRYRLMYGTSMNHMADTGKKGLDLYALEDDGWCFVNSWRPAKGNQQEGVIVRNMDGNMREYTLYLPLYDGIENLEIGVEEEARLERPEVDSPRSDRGKLVFYGSSIMQGGCASRTGMCATNIIQRELDVECVNAGNSGQAKLYAPMANLLASMENVMAFIIDPVPNCTQGQCDTLTCRFIRTIRKAHPDVPVIMVEGPLYPRGNYDLELGENLRKKNEIFYAKYLELKAENPKGLYYVHSDGLQAEGDEGTVDSVHLTDYGFRAYADVLIPAIRKAVGRKALK